MGGEEADDWDIHPEREAIIIGTQDMLLSRALNRGYAASRSRWPMQFGLLHTDCLWVYDEIQLMGAGLATTAQLEAFRYLVGSKDGHGSRSVWMSATMRPDWLKTVDFKNRVDELPSLKLTEDDHNNKELNERWIAKKPLKKTTAVIGQTVDLAKEIVAQHEKHKGRTIVVVNIVKRARDLLAEISKKWQSATDDNLVLIHSRFRPSDRAEQVKKLKPETAPKDLPQDGMICVSTQVIEAGVDVSATTLFTEQAPWASLMQRFGRCNRRGKDNDIASVHWIAIPAKDANAEKVAAPYELDDLKAASEQLTKLTGVDLGSLAKHVDGLKDTEKEKLFGFEHIQVIRRKDLIDLFDTTPDLAGNDIDIDRFVREIEESDVHVFWRKWARPKGHEPPSEDEPAAWREELCSARVGEFRDFAKRHAGKVWHWNFLDKKWEKAVARKIVPGQVFLVHADAGGYSTEQGWNPASTSAVVPIPPQTGVKLESPDATDAEPFSRIGVWQTISQHTNEVCQEVDTILKAHSISEAEVLRTAARWHDWGKAHPVFQNAIDDGQVVQRNGKAEQRRKRPDSWQGSRLIAKAPGKVWRNEQLDDPGFWRNYERPHFRHELASALAVMLPNVPIGDIDRNLIAYLIASHHGKVRLSIRSLPHEIKPQSNCRFARGVWDNDKLPQTDLGNGVIAPAVTLSLEPMELGLCESPPFAGQSSWTERTLHLRDTLGPFRLAYLEAILRAADMRASKQAGGASK
jgi:CRISPR-associated endonuclease/helicase Cas3